MDWQTVKDKIEKKRKEIWFNMPDEVKRISQGDIPRGTSVYGQYLTVLMFAESEMRSLSDETLWGLRESSRRETIDLQGILTVGEEMLTYKMEFLDFVGLTESSNLLREFIEGLDSLKSKEEFREYTDEMLLYINGAHMWVDMIFPCGISMGFQKKNM